MNSSDKSHPEVQFSDLTKQASAASGGKLSSNPPRTSVSIRRIAFMLLIVTASVITPIAMLFGYSLLHHSRRLFSVSIYSGSYESILPIKDNEIWFPFIRAKGIGGGFGFRGGFDCEINRLDLATGQTHSTGLLVPGEIPRIHWQDDQLYVWTETSVYQQQDSYLKKITSIPPAAGMLRGSPFVYNGQLTIVTEQPGPRFWLNHLVAGNWTQGREIVLPTDGSAGIAALGSNAVPVPLTTALARKRQQLSVIQQGTQVHLFLRDTSYSSASRYFAAYRSGFEFADSDDGIASALAPQNVATGWELIQSNSSNAFYYAMTSDRDGCLFTSLEVAHGGRQYGFARRHCEITRRHPDGRWTALSGLKRPQERSISEGIVSGGAGRSYLMQAHGAWGSLDIYPIDGDTVQSDRSLLAAHEVSDSLRRIEFYAVILIAVLSYPAILILGMSLCVRRHPLHQFGLQQAQFASPLRRSLAWLLDWTLIAMICAFSLILHFSNTGSTSYSVTAFREQLALFMADVESYPLNLLFAPFWAWRHSGLNDSNDWQYLPKLVLAVGIDTFFVLWGFKVYSESRHGTTLGKWLLGIQTVQTSLRRISIRHAIVRDVLWCVEFPFCLTPIPAAIGVMLSNSGQRWGDRAADTIVIRRGSTRLVHASTASDNSERD